MSKKRRRVPLFLNRKTARKLRIGTFENQRIIKIMGPSTTSDTNCLITSWYMSQSIQKVGVGPTFSQQGNRYKALNRYPRKSKNHQNNGTHNDLGHKLSHNQLVHVPKYPKSRCGSHFFSTGKPLQSFEWVPSK